VRKSQKHDFSLKLMSVIEPKGGPGVELATLEDAARSMGIMRRSWCSSPRPRAKRRASREATAQMKRAKGIMAYRGLIPTGRLSWAKNIGGGMSMWIGKGRSFICYPVSRSRLVAFVPTNLDSEESWTAPGDLKALGAESAGLDDPVLETIGALDQTFRGGIYDRAPLPYWSTGEKQF
jgi:hypothetical protein